MQIQLSPACWVMSRDQVIGVNFSQYTTREEAKKIFAIFNNTYKTGKPDSITEMEVVRQDGAIQYVDLMVSPIIDAKGQVGGFRSTIRDVTQRKREREELERYRDFVVNVEDACFEFDFYGHCFFCNEPAYRMMGYTREEYMKLRHKQRYPNKEEADRAVAIIKKVYETGQPSGLYESQILCKDGITVTIEMYVNLIRDKQGNPVGWRGTGRDVTAKKKAQVELERYRDFVVNVKDACFEFDFYGHCHFCNETAHRMLGYTREEYMNLRLKQRYPNKEEADRVVAIMKNIYDTRQSLSFFESEIMRKDGSMIMMEMSVSLILDKQGNPIGWRGTGRDITAKKKEQAELERYRDFMENIADGCFENDLAGTNTYTNEIGARRLGLTKEEFIGMNSRQYTKPEEAKRIARIFGEIYRTGKPAFIDEYELIRKDGQTFFIEMSASLIRDAAGKPIGFRGTTRDITEKKKTQDKLKESEAKYRSLTENMNDVVWTTDMNLVITYMSPSVKKALDYVPEELIGRSPGDVMTPASLAQTLATLDGELKLDQQGKMDPGRSVEFETVYYHKNGSKIWFSNVASFIRNDKGEITGIHGVSRNITEWKHAAAEREKLIADLQTALSEVKTLSGLLPICSHCKKVRDDKGYWNQIENYLLEHSGAFVSHGICPECAVKYYPDIFPGKKPHE